MERIELPTSCSQSRRSTRLSYTQIKSYQFVKERLLQQNLLSQEFKTLSSTFSLSKKQNPRNFWYRGFVIYLLTFTNYTQTSDDGAHDPLSLNVRYSGACFVMCISLSILVYIQLILKNRVHLKIFFACNRAIFVFPKLLQYDLWSYLSAPQISVVAYHLYHVYPI